MVCLASFIYTHISVRACERAGVQACGRASVDKNEFERGVISVRAWSVKRAGVEWQSYKARLLYVEQDIVIKHADLTPVSTDGAYFICSAP